MNWDIEFCELTETYQLIVSNPYAVYDLESEDYEDALDEAGAILESIGYYEEV